jgi:monoamine oxidase
MGLMNKVVLQFPRIFWPTDAYAISYASPTKGENRWFYNCYNNTNTPTLALLVSAKPARKIEEMTDQEVVESAMNVLRKIYGSDVPDPVASFVTRWGKNPFSFGSYSFHRVGATANDFDAFKKIVDRVLWFAGEHTIKEYFGTVHGRKLESV